jgi:hypothetical protein
MEWSLMFLMSRRCLLVDKRRSVRAVFLFIIYIMRHQATLELGNPLATLNLFVSAAEVRPPCSCLRPLQ